MMRLRTVWDWRLRLYPLVVIPALIYVAAQGWNESADRGKPNPATGQDGPAIPVSAPLSGFHKGTAVTCERRREITFCFQLNVERR